MSMNFSAQKISSVPLSLNSTEIGGRVFLAPMSGVTDLAMRRIAQRTGAPMVVSEMVASDDFVNGRREASLRAEGEGLSPHVVQIAGCDPYWMGEAARLAESAGASIIDINMGCPSKRVNGRLSGSALMRDLDHAVSLIDATIAAVSCPVTVKMRLGWDENNLNAAQLALRAENAGAQMIFVHGRTRSQFYKGKANWRAIRSVCEAVSIPVVANGDCHDGDDARQMLAQSGAAAIMVGRAAVGQPWLIGALSAQLEGRAAPALTTPVKISLAIEHLEGLMATMGARNGIRHARKHLAAYADHARPALVPGSRLEQAWQQGRRDLVTSTDGRQVKMLLTSLMADEMSMHAELNATTAQTEAA